MTNEGVMERVSGTIAARILSSASLHAGDTVAVDISRNPQNLLFGHACVTAFQKNGLTVLLDADSSRPRKTTVTLSSAAMSVAYRNADDEEVNGRARIARRVTVTASAAFRQETSREYIPATSYTESALDTVELQSVGQLENLSMPWTHADLPHEGGIDRFVEPFVIIGATAVAIYLFFSLRS